MIGSLANKWIYGIIGAVVLFTLVAELYPTMTTAGDSLNSSGIPFGTFFATGGLTYILLGVALLLVVVGIFMPKGRK